MEERQIAVPCALMRGGTSKGAYFLAKDLPVSVAERDALLLSLMGSVHYAADGARDFLQQIVDTLRLREVSWADIGERLGVSRQSAWERFS